MRFKRCPRCNTLNSLESKTCVVCGFELNYFFCRVCGTKVEEGSESCPNCRTYLRVFYRVPAPIEDFIADPKFKVYSKEDLWTTVFELNPNITRIQVNSSIFDLFSNLGNLYDAMEIEKGKFLPVLSSREPLAKFEDVWESLGDEDKINLIIDFVDKIKDFTNLYFPEKISEVLLDKDHIPLFPVVEESEKGFVPLGVFLQEMIRTLKGAGDSIWEREKYGFLQGELNIRRFLNWLKTLKDRLRIPLIRYAGISDKGPVRSVNEDAILLLETSEIVQRLDVVGTNKKYLFILSDGLGGHEKGEVAAELIIEGMKKEFYKGLLARKQVEVENIVDCVEVVNNFVYSLNQNIDNSSGRMGGTISGLFIDGLRFIVFNVGDSPIFVFEDGSYYEASQRDISTKKAKAITQAIGVKTSKELDVHIEELKTPAEKFKILICSDGLTDAVPEEVIFSVVMDDELNLHDKCESLLEEAYKRKTTDNVSIILVEVEKNRVIGSEK